VAELDGVRTLPARDQGGMGLEDRIIFFLHSGPATIEHASARLIDHAASQDPIMRELSRRRQSSAAMSPCRASCWFYRARFFALGTHLLGNADQFTVGSRSSTIRAPWRMPRGQIL